MSPLFALVLAAATPVPTQAVQPITFAGVTLGESAAELVAQRGEPVARSADGTSYLYVGAGSTGEVVHLTRGSVREIEVDALERVDPTTGAPPKALGITIRDPESKLAALAPAQTGDRRAGSDRIRAYRVDASTSVAFVTSPSFKGIRAILVVVEDSALPKSDSTAPPLHDGTSFSDAVVLKAPNESVGVMSEYAWLSSHPCTGGIWRLAKQSLVSHDKTPYDVLNVTCSAGAQKRDVYFDIGAYFGKQ